jgi:hypothetical protein
MQGGPAAASTSLWVKGAPSPAFFLMASPRLRWFLAIAALAGLLIWGEGHAGTTLASCTTPTPPIRDLGFELTRSLHAPLAAAPRWVLDVLAVLNTMCCAGVIAGCLLAVLRDSHFGVAVCLYGLLVVRLLFGFATALPRPPDYLHSWYDQPNALSSAYIFVFSGHSVLLTFYGVWLWGTSSKRWALLVHFCNAGQWIFMLSTRGHYTLDLLLGAMLGAWGASQEESVTRFCKRQEDWLAQQVLWIQKQREPASKSQDAVEPRNLSVAAFRAHYRKSYPYSVAVQVGGLGLACSLSLACAAFWIFSHQPSQKCGRLTFCCTFLGGLVLANGLEYVLHGLWQHASHKQSHMEHHRFFTAQVMHADVKEDVFAIVQELYQAVAVIAVVLPCLSLALGSLLSVLLGGVDGALIFAAYLQAAFTLYYVSSELVHFYHHRPCPTAALSASPWWKTGCTLVRLPPFCWLKSALDRMSAHHMQHHDPALMQKWNRNINFPLFDLLCGTQK